MHDVKPILSLQILRALAAVAVTVSHFQFDLARITDTQIAKPAYLQLGIAGVDLFFVISGFVMVYASEPLYARTGGPSTFFMHRVIRIVPLYWLVTGLYLLIAVIIPAFDKGYSFNMVAASLFFIPYMKPEGVMQPIVGQGWTLNYEMMFYVIFALAVVGSRQVAVAIALSTLVGACIAGWALQPLPPMMAFWTNPIILEFTYGMLIAVAWREGFKLRRQSLSD